MPAQENKSLQPNVNVPKDHLEFLRFGLQEVESSMDAITIQGSEYLIPSWEDFEEAFDAFYYEVRKLCNDE